MRIGIDIDGVLAQFNKSFIPLVIELTGVDKFGQTWVTDPDACAPTWNYPEYWGYTKDQTTICWENIKGSTHFWGGLDSYPDVPFEKLANVECNHDVYYITSRMGIDCLQQTKGWLRGHDLLGSVLISSEKGLCAKALNLDCYIDDRGSNIQQVIEASPETRAYLLSRPWNKNEPPKDNLGWSRVHTFSEFMKREGLWVV